MPSLQTHELSHSTGLNHQGRAHTRPHRHGRRVLHPAQACHRAALPSQRLRSLTHPLQEPLRKNASSPRGFSHGSAGSSHQDVGSAAWNRRHHHNGWVQHGRPACPPLPRNSCAWPKSSEMSRCRVLEARTGFRLPLMRWRGNGRRGRG
jgi:hypothetical protein